MKLLFDQNLSPRLVQRLADCFPDSAHLQEFSLDTASDAVVLDFAETNRFVLVSKDSDFFDPVLVRGRKTRVVWIRRGNCSTADIESILRRHVADIANLATTEGLYLLMLY